MVIDTHAHLYPARYLDFLESIGIDASSITIARNLRADDSDTDLSARLQMMDNAGVERQILSATPQLPMAATPGGANAADSASAARMINDIYAEVVASNPDRFNAYGAIPLPFVAESLAEISYIFDELGFLGVAINTFVGAYGALTDAAYTPVFEELDRREAIVYIHPAGQSAGCQTVIDNGFTWVNGAPMEDAIATLQLLKADYPYRFPNIRFHIAHLGGDLAFLSQRIEDNYTDWGAFQHSPRVTLRNLWFDSANFYAPSLRLALETYNPEHIMAGSDYPYFQDDKYTRAFSYIRDSGASPELIEQVLSGNAQHLYGL
ncbi:MAG: amidohydrolase family protein [Varibaculum sp.]|nr:amidohydrolase family protein [Varibaculum sp.]